MRPDIQYQYREESTEARQAAENRRARVLAFPDIAALLTKPPLSLPDPLMWSGYLPTEYWREQHNDSPVRKQIIMICRLVQEREEQQKQLPVAPPLVEEGQLTSLHITFGQAGITDKADKLDYIYSVTNRQVASSKDLTVDEYRLVKRSLAKLIAQEQQEEREDQPHALQVEDQARPLRPPVGGPRSDDGPTYEEVWGEGIEPRSEEEPPY